MAFEIVFLLGADIDFLKIYGSRGESFSVQAEECLRLLARNPRIAPKRFGNQRRLLLTRTPFGLFYTVEGSRILISAIIDLRQHPDQIRRKLQERS